jgi:hypothetical protein
VDLWGGERRANICNSQRCSWTKRFLVDDDRVPFRFTVHNGSRWNTDAALGTYSRQLIHRCCYCFISESYAVSEHSFVQPSFADADCNGRLFLFAAVAARRLYPQCAFFNFASLPNRSLHCWLSRTFKRQSHTLIRNHSPRLPACVQGEYACTPVSVRRSLAHCILLDLLCHCKDLRQWSLSK